MRLAGVIFVILIFVGGLTGIRPSYGEATVEDFRAVSYMPQDLAFIRLPEAFMTFEAFDLSMVKGAPEIIEFIMNNEMGFTEKISYHFSDPEAISVVVFLAPPQVGSVHQVPASAANCPVLRLGDMAFVGLQKKLVGEDDNAVRMVTRMEPAVLRIIKQKGCIGVTKLPPAIAKGLASGPSNTTIYGLEYGQHTQKAQIAAKKYFTDDSELSPVKLSVLVNSAAKKGQKRRSKPSYNR